MAPHEWVMHQPATGIRWNALDAAVGTNDMMKASSMNEVISKLNQLLGRLDGVTQTDDLGKPVACASTSAGRRRRWRTTATWRRCGAPGIPSFRNSWRKHGRACSG